MKHKRLFELQKGQCFYCDKDLIPKHPNQTKQMDDNPTRDHIVTKSDMKLFLEQKRKVNNGIQNNSVLACHYCNHTRGNKPFIEFYMERKNETK